MTKGLSTTLASQAVEQAVVGRRRTPRARVALPARFETLNGTVCAILHNLSESGAMLELPSAPAIDSTGLLRCGDIDCFGTVVWVQSRWCGFAFDEQLPQGMVIQARKASDKGQAVADHRRELAEAAKRWALGAHYC